MKKEISKTGGDRKKSFTYADGRFYFTKEAERSFYFILTLLMLVAGVCYKVGIL